MDDERIRAFERDLWIGGEEVYRERVSRDCLMVLPAEPYVFSGEDAIRAVADTPRWEQVDLNDLRVSRPQDGMIVIAYEARASRGAEHYRAYCTSTYRRRGHEDWEVVQHQQTLGLTH
ncbi:MAG TPA: DUF4440 domain-containing protein [Sphingomicrobium sp.]